MPQYLTENRYKIESEYNSIRELHDKNAEEEAKLRKLLSEEETNAFREGLNKKLEKLKREYANFTHKTKIDTLVLKKRKETLEKEMTSIEKDLHKFNKKNVYVDMTKD